MLYYYTSNVVININDDIDNVIIDIDDIDENASGGCDDSQSGRFFGKINIPSIRDFSWKDYLLLNPDLAYIKTEQSAIRHYLKFGKSEGRQYKIDSISQLEMVDEHVTQRLKKLTDMVSIISIEIENLKYIFQNKAPFCYYQCGRLATHIIETHNSLTTQKIYLCSNCDARHLLTIV